MSEEEESPEMIAIRERWKDATDKEVLTAFDAGELMDADTIKRAERAARRQAEEAEGEIAFPAGRKKERNRLQRIFIDSIYIAPARRPVIENAVIALMEGIRDVGLLHPPVVIFRSGIMIDGEEYDNVPVLVAGRHRVEAWRRLGHRHIDCIVADIADIDAELMEISENLHRAELSALQRDEQIARWIDLTKTKRGVGTQPDHEPSVPALVSRQVDAKPGRPEGGVRAAARELGLSEPDARRAVKVASLSPEAKAAAVATGLDDNRTALLAAAKETEPEKQVEIIHARVASSPTQAADPDLDARIKAREDREKVELAKFLTTVDAVEPLLAELKCEEEVSLYDNLTYLQIAERYKPILALRPYRWRMGYGRIAGDASRRIESAREDILRILTDKAEDELEKAAPFTATDAGGDNFDPAKLWLAKEPAKGLTNHT